jgi:hypothetical protein
LTVSLLDDARRLAERKPDGNIGAWAEMCIFCYGPLTGDEPHKPDCPWLSMPKIVAALDAVECAVEMLDAWDISSDDLTNVLDARHILVAALKGEVVP